MGVVAQDPVCRFDGSLPRLGASVRALDGCWNRPILAPDCYSWRPLCHLDTDVMGLPPYICCVTFHAHLVLPTNRTDLPGSASDLDVSYLVPCSRVCYRSMKETTIQASLKQER